MSLRPFLDHLRDAFGNPSKARVSYMRERGWKNDELWYEAWRNGLGDEVDAACAIVPLGKLDTPKTTKKS